MMENDLEILNDIEIFSDNPPDKIYFTVEVILFKYTKKFIKILESIDTFGYVKNFKTNIECLKYCEYLIDNILKKTINLDIEQINANDDEDGAFLILVNDKDDVVLKLKIEIINNNDKIYH